MSASCLMSSGTALLSVVGLAVVVVLASARDSTRRLVALMLRGACVATWPGVQVSAVCMMHAGGVRCTTICEVHDHMCHTVARSHGVVRPTQKGWRLHCIHRRQREQVERSHSSRWRIKIP